MREVSRMLPESKYKPWNIFNYHSLKVISSSLLKISIFNGFKKRFFTVAWKNPVILNYILINIKVLFEFSGKDSMLSIKIFNYIPIQIRQILAIVYPFNRINTKNLFISQTFGYTLFFKI